MISPRLRVDTFDLEELRRLARLVLPVPVHGGPASASPLLLFVEGARVMTALRPRLTGLEEDDPTRFHYRGPRSLPEVRRRAGARIAVAIEIDAMERIVRSVDAGVDPSHDAGEQWLAVARALRAEQGRGIHVDPDLVARLPVPTFAAVSQTLDAILPDDRAVGLFVFDDRRGHRGGLYASAIVEKRRGDVVRVTSHRALDVHAPGFDRGRHRTLLDAMERRVARPHAALFCTLTAWRDIAGPDAGALARQVGLRGAVIDPVPPWLLALTSIGAAASLAQGASRLFGRFVPHGLVDTARALTQTPFAALGFDPIAIYAELRRLL